MATTRTNKTAPATTMTDDAIKAALTDLHTLALTMYGEARGEEIEGKVAVGCVVRARVADDRWPDTYKDVCLQRWQFSCWNTIDPNYRTLLNLGESLVLTPVATTNPVMDECLWVAAGVMSGVCRDRVKANHYLTRKLWETAPPDWAKGQSPTAFAGRQAFFLL